MPDRRIHIAPILLEAFFVVLGVFLALAANEWREDRNARKRAEIAAASIVEELQANREALREASAFNMALLDSLQAYLPEDAPPLPPYFFAGGFFRPARLFTTAWDAARSTDALNHIPYDEVLQFSTLYDVQGAYETQTEQVGRLLYTKMMDEGFEGATANYRNFHAVLIGLTYFEHYLVSEYDRVLSPSDSTLADSTIAG